MLDPSAASPIQKQDNRRLTTGSCPVEHEAWSGTCTKDKPVEASTRSTGAYPAQQGAWSKQRYIESCQMLIVQIRC
ncbi:hypothetical protein Hanom_Chr03g00208611 [Helianthus anomalus]